MRGSIRTIVLLLATVASCSHAPPRAIPQPHASQPPLEAKLAESVPVETTLDHAWVPDAPDVWLDMIRNAIESIDIAEFYVSDAPGSRLHAVLEEIERAAARGVHVRLLVDETFYAKYPEIPDAWSHIKNIETRRIDLRPGVLHAKYFVVDQREAYVGSQNFDYRSLEHIFEMGVRVTTPHVVSGLSSIFAADWARAGGTPARIEPRSWEDKVDGGDIVLAASPKSMVPESLWDLPRLLSWIGATTSKLRVEVLTYKIKTRHGDDFHDLDDALRAAAKRGVHVELLVSTWGEKDDAVTSLAREPNVEVRVLDIPKHSSGDIPFARVAHAKYALFDEGRAWVGTSNWEGDYFYQSRNVGLFFEHGKVPSDLARVFDEIWSGPYARRI